MSAPTSTLLASATFLEAVHDTLDLRHQMQLEITPTVKIKRGGRIHVRMLDNDYTFEGSFCTSEKTTVNGVEYYSLDSSEYSCTIAENMIVIELFVTI